MNQRVKNNRFKKKKIDKPLAKLRKKYLIKSENENEKLQQIPQKYNRL